jgi:hypothetical protein
MKNGRVEILKGKEKRKARFGEKFNDNKRE